MTASSSRHGKHLSRGGVPKELNPRVQTHLRNAFLISVSSALRLMPSTCAILATQRQRRLHRIRSRGLLRAVCGRYAPAGLCAGAYLVVVLAGVRGEKGDQRAHQHRRASRVPHAQRVPLSHRACVYRGCHHTRLTCGIVFMRFVRRGSRDVIWLERSETWVWGGLAELPKAQPHTPLSSHPLSLSTPHQGFSP